MSVALGHVQAGRMAEAEAVYREVLRLAPDLAGASYNLAVTLRSLGRIDEAVLQYRRTVAIQPGNFKAHNNLAVLLAGRGETEAATRHYRRALAVQPDFASAHYNFANLLREEGELDQALGHYRRALAGAPADPEINNNFGIALAARGRREEAVQAYRKALAARPDYAEALSNLGSVLEDLGRLDEAEAEYRKALALKPDYADARFNLAHLLDAGDRVAEAEDEYERALALDPAHAAAHNNLGFLIQRQNRVKEALARYHRAQEIKPGYDDAEGNEGLARLLLADFDEGWRKYEGRWSRQGRRPLKAPLWDGGGLTGRTILLHPEQGLGDAIQFVRYAPLLKRMGASVVLECPPSLERLFAGLAGVDRLVPTGSPLPAFDLHAPLLSLPRLVGTRLETIPAEIPYLKAPPEHAAAWEARLADVKRPRIGFLWRGNPNHPNDRRRSMPVQAMAEVVGSLDAGWVSLQLDPRQDELAALPPVRLVGPEIGDWADTAAIVEGLDLVITVDTSVAHLAGAMGKPVWMLIPFAPDWRWMLSRTDSPWYPTMRIFRQPDPGDWAAVADAVRAALQQFPQAPAPAPPAPRARPRRRPPSLVVSHDRSGTHILMNALS
jgi:Tfp pilus assembly protein PilF